MAYLILVRHARSEWNAKGIWTGWHDVGLSDHAEAEVSMLAKQMPPHEIHATHTSMLRRAQETMRMLKERLGLTHLPTHAHEALNERDYGIYTGRNKWGVRDEIGEDAFRKMRRGWDHPIPEGETLKDVHARVVPLYESVIAPELAAGKNVLIVAHGNSLRALMKHLEDLSEDEVARLEIGIAEARIYRIEDGRVISHEMKTQEPETGNI